MRVLYGIPGKKIWKACKFFWVHFILPPFYLYSSLGRMGACQSLRVVQLVLQGATCIIFCFDIGTSNNGLLTLLFYLQMIILLCCSKFRASIHF